MQILHADMGLIQVDLGAVAGVVCQFHTCTSDPPGPQVFEADLIIEPPSL